MSRLIGEELNEEIIRKINHERSSRATDEVVLLSTIDDRSFPHLSLLNFLDLAVVSRKKIVFAVGRNSSTAHNLVERKRGTLAFWMGTKKGSMTYIKGNVRRVPGEVTHGVEGFATTAFQLNVKVVLEDSSPKARIISTLRYEIQNINMDHLALSRDLEAIAHKIRKS